MVQIDDALEVFELADHDQHLDKDDSSIYLEVEESRNNFPSSSNDNKLDLSDNELDNNCNVNFEQDMEAETINNTDAEFAINIQDQNDIQPEDSYKYLSRFLKKWAMRSVAHKKIDELAGLRHIHSFLPKSYKTLLQTPRRIELKRNSEGLMWYKSIIKNLNERITDNCLNTKKLLLM